MRDQSTGPRTPSGEDDLGAASTFARSSSMILKFACMGPPAVMTACILLVILADLPDTAGSVLLGTCALVTVLLSAGFGESRAVRILFRARLLDISKLPYLQGVLDDLDALGLGPGNLDFYVAAGVGRPNVAGTGRRSVVASTAFLENYSSGYVTRRETVAVMAHAALVVQSGMTRQDPVLMLWCAPWRPTAFARRMLAGKIVGFAWRVRPLVAGVAIVRSLMGIGPNTDHGLGLLLASALALLLTLSYTTPLLATKWRQKVELVADCELRRIGLAPAMSHYLRRLHSNGKEDERIRRLQQTPVASRLNKRGTQRDATGSIHRQVTCPSTDPCAPWVETHSRSNTMTDHTADHSIIEASSQPSAALQAGLANRQRELLDLEERLDRFDSNTEDSCDLVAHAKRISRDIERLAGWQLVSVRGALDVARRAILTAATENRIAPAHSRVVLHLIDRAIRDGKDASANLQEVNHALTNISLVAACSYNVTVLARASMTTAAGLLERSRRSVFCIDDALPTIARAIGELPPATGSLTQDRPAGPVNVASPANGHTASPAPNLTSRSGRIAIEFPPPNSTGAA